MADDGVRPGRHELVVFEHRQLVGEQSPEGCVADFADVGADDEEPTSDDPRASDPTNNPTAASPTVSWALGPISSSFLPPTRTSVDSATPTVTLVSTLHPLPPTSALSHTQSRLSAGAVAGIAIGASVVTAICLVSTSFLCAKRRKRRSPAAYMDPRSGQHCLFVIFFDFQRLGSVFDFTSASRTRTT